MKALTLYLSRNPIPLYGGVYTLTSYVPKNYQHGAPCWWYHPESDPSLTLHPDGKEVQAYLALTEIDGVVPGSYVNLHTGEVTYLTDPETGDVIAGYHSRQHSQEEAERLVRLPSMRTMHVGAKFYSGPEACWAAPGKYEVSGDKEFLVEVKSDRSFTVVRAPNRAP